MSTSAWAYTTLNHLSLGALICVGHEGEAPVRRKSCLLSSQKATRQPRAWGTCPLLVLGGGTQHPPARTGRQNKQVGKKLGARKGSDAGCRTCTQRAPSPPGRLGVRAHSCPTHGHQHLPFTRNGFGTTKPALPLLMMFNFNFFFKNVAIFSYFLLFHSMECI